MLRRNKFSRFEKALVLAIASLLSAAAVAGVIVAIRRGEWRLAVLSAGVLALAAVYFGAARRNRPL